MSTSCIHSIFTLFSWKQISKNKSSRAASGIRTQVWARITVHIVRDFIYYVSTIDFFIMCVYKNIIKKAWPVFRCNSTIIFIIFWGSLMFYQIFLSPSVKRCTIITYKHGIYGLPHELPNDLRLRFLGT